MSLCLPAATAESPAPQQPGKVTTAALTAISGTVHDRAGKPVAGALVRLEQKGISSAVETRTDVAGKFAFTSVAAGDYSIIAEHLGRRSHTTVVLLSSPDKQEPVDLVLEDSTASLQSPGDAMQFADQPNFTVAGVVDWTAVGGHGSDSNLRTSEALARETLTLKPDDPAHSATSAAGDKSESESTLRTALAGAPASFNANHLLGTFYLRAGRYRESITPLQTAYRIDPANQGNEYDLAMALKDNGDLPQAREHIQKLLALQDNADWHRLAGELDEKRGDPLAAVHEYERATHLDSSEQNYFEWGSELLIHRAVWQAQEVFRKGTEAYPKSARMLSALGTALFASARYEDAAQRLCKASDLNPAAPEPYLFMGKIAIAAPNPLPCIEEKLMRFAQEQPDNSLANYFYAMAILKRQQQSADLQALQKVESLLTKAVAVDNKCSDAFLQLGILYSSQRNPQKAIGFYTKAIAANPQLGEAHYRLGVAYDRMGQSAQAKQEFQLHDEIEKRQADAIEEQRREIKQFQVVLDGKPPAPPSH